MTKIEKLEREIAALSVAELTEFRRWFMEFAASAWDEQIVADVNSGSLDRVAEEALHEYRSARSRPL